MKALIDGDILAYEIGSCTDDEGHPLSWPLCKARLDGKIKSIAESAGATSYTVFLTGTGNFRDEVATIRPYKGNRTGEKPHWHSKVLEYLKTTTNHDVVVCDGYEADDGMSIEQCKGIVSRGELTVDVGGTIICSRDKDLHMVPGWHYSWGSGKQEERKPWFVTENEGMKKFFLQLLTGDATDNIPGLYLIGPVKAEKLLDGLTEPLDMYAVVQREYELRFGSYWGQFMDENAALLWMLREEPRVFTGVDTAAPFEIENILEDFQVALDDREEGKEWFYYGR